MKKMISAIIFVSLTAGLFALPNLLKKEQYGAEAISNLDFSLSSENIKIQETSDSNTIDVEVYSNYKKYYPDISVTDSTLYIDSGRKLDGFFTKPTGYVCTIVVYLPKKKDFDKVAIKTTSGEIIIERSISAKKEIAINSTSGEIKSDKGLFADNVKITSTSGDIDIYNVDADELKTSASSGDITLKKFTGSSGIVHSTSGDIKISDFACEFSEFNSTSGNLTVKKLDCDYFDAENTSGGVSLDLINAPSASSSVKCTSGDIDIYLPMRAKFSVDVSCNSGTFRDKFNNNRLNPRDNYQQEYNGGGSVINLRTTSGNVTLDY